MKNINGKYNGFFIEDPHMKIRPTKVNAKPHMLRENYTEKDWDIDLSSIEVTETTFQKKKSLDDMKRKHNTSSFSNAILGNCLYYFLSFILFGFSIISFGILAVSITFLVAITNRVLKSEDFGTLIPFGIMGVIFGSPLSLLAFVLLIIFCIAPCISAKQDKMKTKIDTLVNVNKYIKYLMTNNKLVGGDCYVECYHYELKQHPTNYKYQYQEKVITEHKTIKLQYDNVVDETQYPDFPSINQSKFELIHDLDITLDANSKKERKKILEKIKKQYKGKDKEIDIFFTPLKIKGINKTFRFQKKGAGFFGKCIDNPLTYGLCFYLTCLYYPLTIIYKSGYMKVRLNIKKKAKFHGAVLDDVKNSDFQENKNIGMFIPPKEPYMHQPTNYFEKSNAPDNYELKNQLPYY